MSFDVSDKFDAIIFGGGIAGMQSSLDLADQGYKVAIIEKDASIGGKMVRFEKVFPTLDLYYHTKDGLCGHHRNITIYTLCELVKLERDGAGFRAKIIKKPRYVNQETCIGCRQCEYACPVMAPDKDQMGLTARKAIYIPFTNAIPQVALLDVESCILCGRCEKVCPTGAVNYYAREELIDLEAKVCIVATGYRLLTGFASRVYGEPANNPNIIDALQLERILAPTGPYMKMLRPGDGKEPESVAFIQCAGSRDQTNGVGYCSRVCCMYAIKNALLVRQELPGTDITIFYIDMRAFGKNYEQFYRNAKEKGIRFVKAKPIIHSRGENGGVILRYEDQEGDGRNILEEFDMAVMSLAILPAWNASEPMGLPVAEDSFLKAPFPKTAPALTGRDGIFMAGVASGPKDIVDSIVEAGAAAMEASNYLKLLDGGR
jgi:heterodisulfide reductase subunit A